MGKGCRIGKGGEVGMCTNPSDEKQPKLVEKGLRRVECDLQ